MQGASGLFRRGDLRACFSRCIRAFGSAETGRIREKLIIFFFEMHPEIGVSNGCASPGGLEAGAAPAPWIPLISLLG